MASEYKGDSQDLRIVLLGVSGAGKSPTGNAILGRDAFKESRTRESETQRGKVEDRNISITDTPGFFNTQLTDEEMKQQMMKSLFLTHPGPHMFLLVINLENFEEDERNVVEEILDNFGTQALKFTMVLFIGKEKMSKKDLMFFKFNTTFRELIGHFKSNYQLINSKNEINPTHITELLKNIDEIIKLNDKQHYSTEDYLNFPTKFRNEKKKGQTKVQDMSQEQIKIVKETIKMQSVKEKCSTHVVSEKKRTQVHEDRCSRVPQENKIDEEEVKQSVKSLRSSFKRTREENVVQKTEKCWKTSATEKWDQKKQQSATEQHPTQAVSESTQNIHIKHGECADLRIVMVGKTGVGKSTTGNTILGQKVFKEEFCTESVTKRCQQHQLIVGGKKISVIDTPGQYDTSISEKQLKEEIMKCVYMSAPGPHVFLLVIRLDVKFTDEEKKTVKWIQENFGEEAAHYTIILFTRGDQLDRGVPIEEFLTKNKHIKELLIQCKGGYHVFNNKDEENRSQVTELLKKIEGMVDKNGGQHYTNEIYKEAQRKIMKKKFKDAALMAAGVGVAAAGGAFLVTTPKEVAVRTSLMAGTIFGAAAFSAANGVPLPEALSKVATAAVFTGHK